MNAYNFREAAIADIPAMHEVRVAVKENRLSDPGRITPEDYASMIGDGGKGWICEAGGLVVAFAIVDVRARNVWALFVAPGHEGKGIGRALHDRMLDWYFGNGHEWIWLSTAPGTRADRFYRLAGWEPAGMETGGEQRYELLANTWRTLRTA